MAYDPPNANGQATMANSSPVVIASDQSAIPTVYEGRINAQGSTYVVPMAPGTASGDRPLTELLVVSANLNTNTNVLPAPGATARYRIFYADLGLRSGTAGGVGALNFGASSQIVVATGFVVYRQLFGAPSGIPLAANALVAFTQAGGPVCDMSVVYTVETV